MHYVFNAESYYPKGYQIVGDFVADVIVNDTLKRKMKVYCHLVILSKKSDWFDARD